MRLLPKMNIKLYFRNALKAGLGFVAGSFSSRVLRDKITIFNYHEVSHDGSEFINQFNLNVTPEVFDFQIGFIKQNFNIISPTDLINNNISQNSALITFDDGFSGVYKNAIPILQKHEVPAIIFLNMGVLKGDLFWAGIVTYLCKYDRVFLDYLKNKISENVFKKPPFLFCNKNMISEYCELYQINIDEQVRNYVGEFISVDELVKADMIDGIFYGNHLENHYVSLNMSDEELLESFNNNEAELKKYKSYTKLFAFPFGQQNTCFDRKQADLIFQAGAEKVFSTHSTINKGNDHYYMHRIPLYEEDASPSMMWSRIFYRSLRDLIK